MTPGEQLSPRAAVIVSLLVIACGIAPILGALEIIPAPLTPGTPVWVGVCAGMLFVLGGLAVMNGYAFRFANREFIQDILGFAIGAVFAAVFGWVAFGSGERHFSSSIELPFWRGEGRGSERIGRAMFGFGALMAVAIAVAAARSAIRKRR